MERKRSILNLIAIFSFCLQACGGKEPKQVDMIGMWKSSDKAELIFNQDGTFAGKLIPAEFGFMPSDSLQNVKFNGSGKWTLRKANNRWEIYLDFDKVNVNKNGCTFSIMVAGENGVLSSKPPWYLYAWKSEEGGERYKFIKINN